MDFDLLDNLPGREFRRVGSGGYSFSFSQRQNSPSEYEDLPKNVEERALVKREEWIRHNFGDVTQTFSNGVVTASDLSSLLEKIETDLSLVHAAYYTEMSALS